MSSDFEEDDDSVDEDEGGIIGLLNSISNLFDVSSKVLDTFSESKTFAKMVKKHKEKKNERK